MRPVAGSRDHQRPNPRGMLHRQVQPREAAHRDADDVGVIDAESIQHRDGVVHGVLLCE